MSSTATDSSSSSSSSTTSSTASRGGRGGGRGGRGGGRGGRTSSGASTAAASSTEPTTTTTSSSTAESTTTSTTTATTSDRPAGRRERGERSGDRSERSGERGGRGGGRGGARGGARGGRTGPPSDRIVKAQAQMANTTEHKAVASIDASIEEIRVQINGIATKITKLSETRDAVRATKEEALNELKTRKDFAESLAKRKAISSKLKAERDRNQSMVVQLREARAALPLKRRKDDTRTDEEFIAANNDFYDKQITKLQESLQNTGLTTREERQIVKEIDTHTAAKKKVVGKYEKLLQTFRDSKDGTVKALNDELTALNLVLDAASSEDKAKRAEYERHKKRVKDISEEIKTLLGERDALYKKIDALRVQRTEAKKALDGKWSQWKKEQDDKHKKEREEYEKRRAEERERAKARAAARAEAEAAALPFEQEILLTDQLTKYLTSIQKGASKRKGPLKHQIDTVCKFESLTISTPKTPDEIAGAIAALAEKKKHFLQLQAKKQEQRAQKAKKDAEGTSADTATTTTATSTESTERSVDTAAAAEADTAAAAEAEAAAAAEAERKRQEEAAAAEAEAERKRQEEAAAAASAAAEAEAEAERKRQEEAAAAASAAAATAAAEAAKSKEDADDSEAPEKREETPEEARNRKLAIDPYGLFV